MENRATWAAGLELRRQGKRPVIAGRFNFNELATLADRGRVRKERIAPGAFDFTLRNEDREVNLLFGHSFDMPLASRRNGSLVLRADDEALTFDATIDPALEDVTHIRDALAMLGAGLVTGISPGFRVPPKEAVPDNERLDPEPGNPKVLIRTILALVLYELSLVTRPAYEASQAELRALQQAAHPVRNKPGVWLP
ncbi:Caudovirus prohead protease [Roseovarius sp. THAF27]|uniref:HK97 family phage prohead protease n=1 Tax=Roseovarius sp. THAF27 TaxID=2587850 RepID=UPI001268F216|nr:HK97 family phage prohead protease [Roseovarius sp. THAF27]QFT80832.1 Caudovirus prohead protease [Roseovarius sp. THAF27]